MGCPTVVVTELRSFSVLFWFFFLLFKERVQKEASKWSTCTKPKGTLGGGWGHLYYGQGLSMTNSAWKWPSSVMGEIKKRPDCPASR